MLAPVPEATYVEAPSDCTGPIHDVGLQGGDIHSFYRILWNIIKFYPPVLLIQNMSHNIRVLKSPYFTMTYIILYIYIYDYICYYMFNDMFLLSLVFHGFFFCWHHSMPPTRGGAQ